MSMATLYFHCSILAFALFHLILFSSLLQTATATATPAPSHQQEQEEDTPITRFQRYLRINTAHPAPDYYSAVSFLKAQAHSLGLASKTIEFTPGKPLLLLTWPGSNPSLPSVLLNSHLDSVPAEPAKWLHPPFSGHRTSDGKIFARGAQDDKCIAVQYLEAIRNLKARAFSPLRSVHISLVPEEEIGGFDGAAKFVESDDFLRLNVGFALDEGQASPGDEFRVFYADRIPWNVKIRAKGAPGHGARMYDGSAMENLMESVEAVSRFRESQFNVVKAGKALNAEVVSVNPVYVKAGVTSDDGFAMNVQPSEAEAGFDLRLTPTTDPDEMRRRIAEEWAPAVRNMSYEIIEKGPIRDYMGRPLMTATNDSNPWWSVFKQAITSVGEKLSSPEIIASTTDARYLRQKGIPVLGFSPMKNTPILLHDHNEHLKDTVFMKGIQVYESLISSLSTFTEASH
ncbi:aminoacylase-1-like [Vigna unguiculata]|uniref:Amidohydrolase n=1 Tax=Vigna unguiculata TaxID=3917 RepID=A0A4D6MHT4_VIGUN|nr:aminoacylase-1-like [Vigna unguiculata]QCE00334.1 amidohydrolase [Vigna unguiculata]